MVAKHWSVCRAGLGAQAGMPVLLEGQPPEGNFKILDLKCGLTASQRSRPEASGTKRNSGGKRAGPAKFERDANSGRNAGGTKGTAKVEHWGANGTEGPFLGFEGGW
jgi:hypothetical protein